MPQAEHVQLLKKYEILQRMKPRRQPQRQPERQPQWPATETQPRDPCIRGESNSSIRGHGVSREGNGVADWNARGSETGVFSRPLSDPSPVHLQPAPPLSAETLLNAGILLGAGIQGRSSRDELVHFTPGSGRVHKEIPQL